MRTDEDGPSGSGLASHVGFMVLLLVVLQGCFFLCNLAAELVPKDAVVRHLEESADSPLLSRNFDYGYHALGSAVSFDNNRFIKSLAEKRDYGGDLVKASVMDTIDYDIGGKTMEVEYYRYWHGWQLLAFLCLWVGHVSLLSRLIGLFVVASSVLFVLELRRYVGTLPSVAFAGIAFFTTGLFANYRGDMLMALSVFAVVACSALMLHFGSLHQRFSVQRLDCLCVFAGSLFCFLDFFTIPSYVITFTTFSALVASNDLHAGFKTAFSHLIRFSALFLIGFVATWVSKWLLASIYLGLQAVMNDVFSEAGMWTKLNAGYQAPRVRPWLYAISPRLYAVVESFEYVLRDLRIEELPRLNPSGLIGVAMSAACVLGMLVRCVWQRMGRRHVDRTQSRKPAMEGVNVFGAIACALPALYVPLYAAVAYLHTIWHMGIFGYKPWAVSLGVVACLSSYVALYGWMRRPQPRHAASVKQVST